MIPACVFVGSRGISLTCVLTPCRVIGVCVVLMTLGAIGTAVWAVGQTTHKYTWPLFAPIQRLTEHVSLSTSHLSSFLLHNGGRHRSIWWWVHDIHNWFSSISFFLNQYNWFRVIYSACCLCSSGQFRWSTPESLRLYSEEVAQGVLLLSQWAAG